MHLSHRPVTPLWGQLSGLRPWNPPASADLLLLAAVATLAAKAYAVSTLSGVGFWPLAWLRAVLVDLAVYLGAAALLTGLERRAPRSRLLTLPVAGLLAAIGLINAGVLAGAGEQINWTTVRYGVDRWDDLSAIVREMLAASSVLTLVLAPLVFLAAALAVRWTLRRRAALRLGVVRTAGLVAAPALLLTWTLPEAELPELRRLEMSALTRTLKGMVAEPAPQVTVRSGFIPAPLVQGEARRRLGEGQRPNVLFVVLESTRWDATELAPKPMGPVRTPHLLALARRGTVANRMRTVLPHTTKSLYSIFCSRLPSMQEANYEIRKELAVECLPGLLARSGWRTGFFQSAAGYFENRPRLLHNLGFQHFEAREDIGGEQLGYLSSDDESLTEPVLRWIDQSGTGGPWLATVLTSGPHHPYRIPKRTADRAAATGSPLQTREEKYLRLVEAEDALLGALVEGLAQRGLLDDTLVIALGDHGEGFGRKGARQHDNNFYEEGLRVPFVMAGPGVPAGKVHETNSSLLDVTPTLLGLLGAPAARPPAEGWDLFDPGFPADRPHWFTCMYHAWCDGFVVGNTKVVVFPGEDKTYVFDLERDPEEASPRTADVPPPGIEELNRVLSEHRLPGQPELPEEEVRFSTWLCEPRDICSYRAVASRWRAP